MHYFTLKKLRYMIIGSFRTNLFRFSSRLDAVLRFSMCNAPIVPAAAD